MGVASRAKDLSSCLSQSSVDLFTHVLFGNRLPKTRPSGARVKLRLRTKQRQRATDAFKYALLVNVIQGAGKGWFGSLLPRHSVLIGCEYAFPFFVSLNHFFDSFITGLITIAILQER